MTSHGMRHGRERGASAVEAAIVTPVVFAMIFGIVYISVTSTHRQRMAMIDKGIDPGGLVRKEIPYRSLRNGMFMVAIGLGLLAGQVTAPMFGEAQDSPLPHFVYMLVFGGIALIAHHFIVRRKQQG